MSLTRSEAVLKLGKKLVAQLDGKDDLLASWMAHYIAQRIEVAQNALPEDRGAAEAACAEAILELWRHRSSFPAHLRPLAALEPIQRTLASLDVDRTDYRYHPVALREAATADADEPAKKWLDLAIGIDYTARLLLQLALRSAADRAASESEPWVELAREAGAEEGPETFVIRFVRSTDEIGEADGDKDKAALLDKVSRLEKFAKIATSLARDLRGELSHGNTEE